MTSKSFTERKATSRVVAYNSRLSRIAGFERLLEHEFGSRLVFYII